MKEEEEWKRGRTRSGWKSGRRSRRRLYISRREWLEWKRSDDWVNGDSSGVVIMETNN